MGGCFSSSSATNKNVQNAQTLIEEENERVIASKINDAIEKYNQAIELSRKPSYFRNRASVLQQYNLAIQDLHAAFETVDKYAKGSNSSSSSATNKNIQIAQTLIEEGNECVKASKFNDAIEKYNQAIELNCKPSYFCSRAAAYCYLKQYDLAIQDCRFALEIDNKCAKAYGQMGVAYYNQKHMGASHEARETAVAIDPFYMFDDEYKIYLDLQKKRFYEAKAVYDACRSALDNKCSSRKRTYAKDVDSFYDFLNNGVKVTREYMVPSKKAKTVQKFFEADMEEEDVTQSSEDVTQSSEDDDEWEEEEETIQLL